VTGSGIAGATVADLVDSITADTNGIYVLPQVPEGTYMISASAPGYAPQSTTATVAPGATTTAGVTLVPEPGAISGAVTDSITGIPIPGATVAYDTGSSTTDSNGIFALSGLDEGSYTITASAPGYETESLPVAVAPGATTTSNFSLIAATG
jgi:large repetitive protein